eukprot:890059-Alexandrium_andersonii.AAC.1
MGMLLSGRVVMIALARPCVEACRGAHGASHRVQRTAAVSWDRAPWSRRCNADDARSPAKLSQSQSARPKACFYLGDRSHVAVGREEQ